jgi:hypothetical protein
MQNRDYMTTRDPLPMINKLLVAFLLLASSGKSFCRETQGISKRSTVLMTVCEALQSRHEFNGKAAAIIGDRSR